MRNLRKYWYVVVGVLALAGIAVGLFYSYSIVSISEDAPLAALPVDAKALRVTHLETPDSVRALYMSAWIAGNQARRERLVQLIEDSDLNAVVIDIKDATGRVSFSVDDPVITKIGSPQPRISDAREFIASLHERGIYVIGRISVFQDPYLANLKPEWAIKNVDGGVWRDRGGLSFLSPASPEVADYTVRLARASYQIGFDEINFDYIRFPSDGDIKAIDYPIPEGSTRADVLETFYGLLYSGLGDIPVVTSADLFGLVTNSKINYDLGIGQVLERALPYFDYICPMIYPSHYPSNFIGFAQPAEHPYEIISHAMKGGIAKAEAAGYSKEKLRPWIQDFDLGGVRYGAEEVEAQIKALSDLGLDSFMSWDPANSYTRGAYKKMSDES